MIGTTLGQFRIKEKLGAGGMGEVYRALDLRLGRQVALKFMRPELAHDPEARRRFEREARALAALDHPNVGAVYGVHEADGRLFMALAYVPGRSLDGLLAGGPLDPGRARRLLAGVARGLHAAHARGIVHRDIKCSNILVGEGDVPKLVDFGIALDPGETRLTVTGALTGTPGFTAPEIYRGEEAGPASDLFSLGVVAYQLLTGRHPFDGPTPMAVMHRILNEDVPGFPEDLPAAARALEPVVRRCLERDPAARFPSADALAAALDVDDPAPHPRNARPPAARGNAHPRSRARGLLLVAAVVAGVAAVAIVTWTQRRPAGPAPVSVRAGAVAILPFKNATGDPAHEWLGPAVAELLGSALTRSGALDVFDAQRLKELSAHEVGGAAADTGAFARLVRAGIGRAITGNILRSGDRIRLQARVVDVGSGRVIRAAGAEGPAAGDLFGLVGGLIPDVQVALEVELSGNREAEAWLREITTSSVDAYRFYLEGHEALVAAQWVDARRALEQAVALDSGFTAAWADLVGTYWNLGAEAPLESARARLLGLRDRADARARLRIDQMDAIIAGDAAEVIRTSQELIRLYPENRFYRYLLGRGQHTSGEHRRALATLAPLVAQGYEWPWTYMLTSRSYRALGATDSGEAALRTGLAATGGSPELALELALLLEAGGDAPGAQRELEAARRSPRLAQTPLWQGRILFELARLNLAAGQRDSARAQWRRSLSLLPPEDPWHDKAVGLRRAMGN